MRPHGHVRAMVGPDDIRWYGIRFDDRHLIKRLPRTARWWSRALGCWITPTDVATLVRAWLQAEGYTVALVDVSTPPTAPARQVAETSTPTGAAL